MVGGYAAAMSRLALVTEPHSERWEDEELPLIVAALDRAGVAAERVPWSAEADWAAFSLVVVRSPWDLYQHIEDFLAWTRGVETATTVLNPPSVLRWTLDKRYLRELAEAGVSAVPTQFIEPGQAGVFPDGEFVIKPVTSGGAMQTARYAPDGVDAARAHVGRIHARGLAAMVQPYLDHVDSTGERALIFFNGVFSHAIRKDAVLRLGDADDADRESHPSPRPYPPTAAEHDLAAAAMAAVPRHDELLYARVDVADLDDGTPAIMELELVDPWFFLRHGEGSAERYAAAIAQRLSAL
jgi:glutathione synthase/RimK-type ligase-like ATP-grasp enzyme